LLAALIAGQRRAVECVAAERASLEAMHAGRIGAPRWRTPRLYRWGILGLLAMQDGLEFAGYFWHCRRIDPVHHPEWRTLSRG